MQTVSFKKYADIIVNLQMKNEFYPLIKRFDDDTLDHIRSQFDKESGLDFMERFNRLSDEIVQLQKENVPPESEKCRHCKAKMKRKDPKISEKLYATRKSSRLRDFESTRPAH